MSEYAFSPGGGQSQLIYDYTCQAAKASIDTNVDGPMARLFSTDGTVLEVWLIGRTDEAVVNSIIDLTFNNDSGSNYDRIYLDSSGGTASAGSTNAATSIQVFTAGASQTAGQAGIAKVSIPAYADITFNKIAEYVGGSNPQSGAGQGVVELLTWRSSAAITRIKVAPDTAGKNFVAGSRLLVYRR